MPQSRKRRQTKHRGNAAGMVESRGRTGRKPGANEKALDPKAAAAQRRLERMNRPPTWRGALNRAGIAAVILIVVSLTLLDQSPAQAFTYGAFALLFYIPMSYFLDLGIYRRRQKRQAAKRAKPA